MPINTQISRRTMLRGVGAAMALPLLDAMRPAALAAGTASASAVAPVRMAFIFFANGAIMDRWKVKGEGKDFQFSQTLQPLADLKSDINVFSGLTQHHGRANGDGGGDHARNASVFLTGCQAFKTSGADIKLGVSVDQAAAADVGKLTRLPSIELGVDRSQNAGNCDSGYSCAYSSNISWKTPTTPMAKEINPRLAFERLFGSGEDVQKQKRRDAYRQSILDLVAEDARNLKNRLGKTDRQKVDEYFTSVRELEARIQQSAVKAAEVPEYNLPEGIPRDTAEHIRLMYDIMALAFQTDSTRIATFMLANAGSNRSYPEVEVKEGHHSLSHHREDEDKKSQIARIDKFLVEQYAGFLKKLRSIKEGDGTLLDNCMILYGSAIADGNRHSHDDLPIILAGKGGGTIQTDRHLAYPDETPMNNLFLSMLDRVGAKVESIGDSKGRLKHLEG
jgi:hypothetical protein